MTLTFDKMTLIMRNTQQTAVVICNRGFKSELNFLIHVSDREDRQKAQIYTSDSDELWRRDFDQQKTPLLRLTAMAHQCRSLQTA